MLTWVDVQDEAFLALYIAAHGGHIRLVLMILSYGVNVNFSTKLGRTALHAAGTTFFPVSLQ